MLNELKLKAREHAESEVKKLDITKDTENKYKEYKAKESEYIRARDNNTLPKEELTALNKERKRIKEEYQKLESERQTQISIREDKLIEHIHRSTSATMGQLMGFNYEAAGKKSANQMFQDLKVAEKSTPESRQAGKEIPIEHPDRITVINQQKDLIVTWLNSKLEANRRQALLSASNSLKNFTKADFDSPAKQDEINNVFRSIAENYNGKGKPQAVTMDYAEKVRKAYLESRFPKKQ